MLETIFGQLKRIIPSRWHWVLEHEGFRRYFANTGWLFGGQMFTLALSFLVGAWVARYLGPENYGVLNYALGLAGIFGFLASLGVDGVLVRDLVRYPEKKGELMGTSLMIKGVGGGLAFLASVALAALMDVTPLVKLLVAVFSLSYVIQPFNILSILFQARVEARKTVKAQIVANIISSVAKIAWIFSGYGVIYLMAIYLFDSLLNVFFLWFMYRRESKGVWSWKIDRSLFRHLIRSGWPLMLSGAAAFLLFKVDQVMIGRMLGEVQVGLYAAAAKVSEVWYFIPSVLCASLFPAIINAKKADARLYRNRLRNFYFLMAVVSGAIIIPIWLLSGPLVHYLFGSDFLAAIPVLQIHVFSALGIFLGQATTQYLIAENRERDVFCSHFLAMVINVGLNFWLIPVMGIVGAAIATLAAYSVPPIYVWTISRIILRRA